MPSGGVLPGGCKALPAWRAKLPDTAASDCELAVITKDIFRGRGVRRNRGVSLASRRPNASSSAPISAPSPSPDSPSPIVAPGEPPISRLVPATEGLSAL